jgi:cytochrome c2
MKGTDFVWDTGKLDSFIAKPDEVVPGNNMKPSHQVDCFFAVSHHRLKAEDK